MTKTEPVCLLVNGCAVPSKIRAYPGQKIWSTHDVKGESPLVVTQVKASSIKAAYPCDPDQPELTFKTDAKNIVKGARVFRDEMTARELQLLIKL